MAEGKKKKEVEVERRRKVSFKQINNPGSISQEIRTIILPPSLSKGLAMLVFIKNITKSLLAS